MCIRDSLKPHGIKSASSFTISKGDELYIEIIIEKVGLPCFVKASKSGSSYGISKVSKIDDFEKAIEIAYKEDTQRYSNNLCSRSKSW